MNKAVILAGGQGKRMKADMPKPLFKVLGEPMLRWVISACEAADLSDICVVKGFKGEMIDEYLGGKYTTVLQAERLGTGHAVKQAVPFLEEDTDGNTLVLCGDAPFIDADTIKESLIIHKQQNNAVTVITAELEDPFGYGRIIRSAGGISGIVEQKDATEEQRMIKEVNSGTYWFRTADLIELLGKLENNNVQNEYYLTDTISIALAEGKNAGAYKSENPDIIRGANDRKDLLELNTYARMAVIEKHLANGVEFTCTDGVVIERGVEIGTGTEILPNTIIRKNTTIGRNCKIGPNTVVENCKIGDDVNLHTVQAYESEIEAGVKIGPYVHIRPDSVVKTGAKIGDFVEIKNSTIGEKTAIAHLAYVGDSDVGKRVNIGCGTVTVNYDGIAKSRCVIGDNCFIGCNTNLIAPVKLGKAVYTAAGTTVTRDVPDYALAIDRGVMKVNEGYTLRKLKSKLGK
ncbi:bifunctional UDP-N-acetylglucosamine diphosphorylase/glucosamine-1-phosphate N-acetyltransferase GlmU [uncultured Ruminococcus sp.]|uniref:bifunctional UDP-N-acetylglucosamine diphosphorylase/glucosamine-1-phosphate N-acetyltransferase GlmU n=1 Tax=uncultured Ruminococcus sp. TaxID=165186 RepID=UPI00260C124F|nr:bifunctional UDP-N-acetylglucosamine diphosphorylase/glucosamine-1-phosphate N-acetyltransferase GlmU [uncultured Ruminococcus sp.]